MGNRTGAASGNPNMSAEQRAGMQYAGQGLQQQGRDQQEALIEQLARMGPPPQLPMSTAPLPQVGQQIAGQYKAQMKPPNVNYRTKQDAQMNPSVGQMLVQGGY